MKYVLTPGQVNLFGWLLLVECQLFALQHGSEVEKGFRSRRAAELLSATYASQRSGMFMIWKFMTPVHTNADTVVAATCAMKVWRCGILR